MSVITTSRRDAVLRLLGGARVALVARETGMLPEELLRWKNVFVRAGSAALAVADGPAGDEEPALDWGWEEQQLGWMVTQLTELLSDKDLRGQL